MPGYDAVLPKLTGLVAKVRLHSPEFSNVDFRVFQDDANKGLYFIEVSRGRCSRTVRVEIGTAANINAGFADVLLVKEIRSALQMVATQAKERDAKASRIARRR